MKLGAAAALIALCIVARADSGVDAARRSYESGSTHFNLGEFRQALNDFTEAYRIHTDPKLLFDIAQCHRMLDEPASAARTYRTYLREVPDAPNRLQIEKLIEDMERATKAGPQPSSPPATWPAPTAGGVTPGPTTTALLMQPKPRKVSIARKPWFWVTIVGSAAAISVGVALGVVYGTHDPVPSAGRVNGN